jgi:SAM-dependent methyltransferase
LLLLLRIGRYSRSETFTEHDVIRKNPEFLGCCLDAVDVQELDEPLPRMFVLGVVVVRQYRGKHVPLEVLQRQVAPHVARRGSSARGEPPLLVQREAASVIKVSELMHVKGDPPLGLLEKILDLVGRPPVPEEPLAVLVFGYEVAPRTQTDDSHSAIINTGRTRWQVGSPRGRCPDRSAQAASAPFTMTSPAPGDSRIPPRPTSAPEVPRSISTQAPCQNPSMIQRRVGTGSSPSRQWEEHAAAWVRWAREPGHDSYWRFHRDVFLRLLEPPPRRVLDLGCGEGRLARDLKSAGYDVVGVDASPTMLDAARAADPAGAYAMADGVALPFGDCEFQEVVAFMSLHDMDDFEGAIAEAVRVLSSDGRLCLAVVHPMNSAGTFESEAPDARFVIEDAYMDVFDYSETVERDGMEMTFSSVHRPLHAYFDALAQRGLVVERLQEVGEDAASVEVAPRRERWQRLPLFLHLRARRG